MSNNETSVLEIWWVWSTPSPPLLQGPSWSFAFVAAIIPSIVQIDMLLLLIWYYSYVIIIDMILFVFDKIV